MSHFNWDNIMNTLSLQLSFECALTGMCELFIIIMCKYSLLYAKSLFECQVAWEDCYLLHVTNGLTYKKQMTHHYSLFIHFSYIIIHLNYCKYAFRFHFYLYVLTCISPAMSIADQFTLHVWQVDYRLMIQLRIAWGLSWINEIKTLSILF